MARKSKRFNLPKIATLTVVILAVVGIGATVLASQQQTSTESEAACNRAPVMTRQDTIGKSKSVVYKFKISSPCSGTRGYRFKITSVPDKNPFASGGAKGWSWRFDGGEWNQTYLRTGVEGGTTYINLEIQRPDVRQSAGGSVERPRPGRYTPFVVEVSLRYHPDLKDTLNLEYNIE